MEAKGRAQLALFSPLPFSSLFRKKKKDHDFLVLFSPFFLTPFRFFFFFFLRLGRRQLRARPGSGRQVAVQAEGDRLVPLALLDQARVEGREQKLRARRHKDAADARGGEAVAREQSVERPLAALQVEAPRQQGLLQVRGRRRGEQLLVFERDLDAVREREGLRGDRVAERFLVGEEVGRARRRGGVDLRGRDQRPARRLVPVDLAGRFVEVRGLGGERRVQALVRPAPLAGVHQEREARRGRRDGLREGALRAAAGEVGEGGVGDEVDGDLRDLEVVRRVGDLRGVLDVLPEGPDADRAGRQVVFLFEKKFFFPDFFSRKVEVRIKNRVSCQPQLPLDSLNGSALSLSLSVSFISPGKTRCRCASPRG